MHKYRRKLLILVPLLIVGGLAWYFDLFRASDCLLEGGRWVSGGQFCRLDHPPG